MQQINKPKATSSLASWLSYLEQLHNKTIDLGLERIKTVAQRLDLLQPAPYVITVAGTNGKGTTCCTLEAILLAAGYRVGVYSSPHLINYTERVRINGNELREELHSQALAFVEEGRADISLTYFEFGTLSAFQLFKQAALDVVILEVGLGGRLDATNIVDANVAVITSIAIDHTDWLGSDRESIGREKAGILRTERPAVIGERDIPQSVMHEISRIGAKPFCCGLDWHYQVDKESWQWSSASQCYQQLPMPVIPIANAATALAALSQSSLAVSEEAIRQGLKAAKLPGRFQLIQKEPTIILDVAHNPHAAAYLAEKLASLPKTGKLRAVVGMLNDKDIEGALAHLLPLVDKWYCASLAGPRGTKADYIAQFVPSPSVFDDVKSAWNQVLTDADVQDTIIVFGSFHTVADVLEIIKAGGAHG